MIAIFLLTFKRFQPNYVSQLFASYVFPAFSQNMLLWCFLSYSILKVLYNQVKVAQSCLTFSDPMDYAVLGNLQARILEWVTFPLSRGSLQPRDRTQVLNPSLLHSKWILYQLSHKGSPYIINVTIISATISTSLQLKCTFQVQSYDK